MMRWTAVIAICAAAIAGAASAQEPLTAEEKAWEKMLEEQEEAADPRNPFDLAGIRTKFATNPMLERMEVRARATFRGIDVDRDGEVTALELGVERKRTFRAADANADQRLTTGEFLGYYGRLAKDRITDFFWKGDVQKEFFRLDENLDSRLSEAEWVAPALWFVARYDLNRDQVVFEDEYVRELLPNTRKPR